jgi:putative transposase
VRYAFIFTHAERFQIRLMTRLLNVSNGGSYAWLKRRDLPLPRTVESTALLGDIQVIHRQSRGTYGSPRVHASLRRNGSRVSKHRVARLMRTAGLCGKQHRQRRVCITNSVPDQPRVVNRLKRDFTTAQTNHTWQSDLTYLPTLEGWLYLCVVLDVCSRRIVGWAFSSSLEARLVVGAFEMAGLTRRPQPELVFHSDQGVQYASLEFRQALSRLEAVQSMSRKGNCWDNAPCESLFATLKLELDLDKARGDKLETQALVFEWMEVFDNRQRLHSSLGFMSPAEFELARAIPDGSSPQKPGNLEPQKTNSKRTKANRIQQEIAATLEQRLNAIRGESRF